MDSHELNMWQWDVEKWGVVDALRVYYATTLKEDPRLQLAITQIELAEAAIRGIMKDREA